MNFRILGNFCSKQDSDEFVQSLLSRNLLRNLEDLLNFDLSGIQPELFENILLILGNLVSINEAVRFKVFETDVMNLVMGKYSQFEDNIETCSWMAWLITNLLNSKFKLMDELQFDLFTNLVKLYNRHNSVEIFKECIWSMEYLLHRESKVAERIQCIVQSNLIPLIMKQIRYFLSNQTTPEWSNLGFKGLAEFIGKAGSKYCSAEFTEVVHV